MQPPAGLQPTRRRAPLVALLMATAVSQLGNRLTLVAIPWYVLETTGSAGRTGIVGATTTVAVVLAAFFGGTLVDRLGFRFTSVISDIASGITVALIPLLDSTLGLAFWQLVLLVFLGAVLDAPGGAARQSLFPDLVTLGGYRLDRANAVFQGLWRMSFLLGPPLAGALIVLFGVRNVLWLDAVSFGISAMLIGFTAPGVWRASSEIEDEIEDSPLRRGFLTELGAGLGIIARDRLITVLLIASTFGNALGGAVEVVVLPVYANRFFGDAASLGLMLGGFGLGSLISVALFGAIGYRFSRRTVFIGSQILSAAPPWIIVTTPPLGVMVGAQTLDGVASGPHGPLVTTIYQERVPTEMRGRFFGAVLALDNATTPLAILGTGFLLEGLRFETAVAMLALASLTVGVFVSLQPALRELDRTRE